MAEKNTLSILEIIKKKMGKLDQKPKPENKIADLSEEFQYITPTKKAAEAVAEKKEETAATKPAIKFEDDLGFEDPKKPAAPVVAAPTPAAASPAKTEKKLEDFNLDDLDADDETALAKKPVAPDVAKVETKAGEGFSEEDIEDYEDSVDLSTEEEKSEEAPEKEEAEDDLNLDELEIDNLEEEPKAPAAQEQEDDLDLSALDLEDEKAAEIPQKKPEAEDDLNLDDLELEPEETAPKPTEEKDPLDELSLEELEKESASTIAKTVAATQKPTEEKDPLDDISLEELEKESEEAAAKIVKKEPEKEDNLDDIDLGDLEIKTEQPAKKEEVENDDDLDLSDLEEESSKEVALAAEKGRVEKQISPQDEIDLEFGREIMGAVPIASGIKEQKIIPNQQVELEEEFEIDQPIHQELPQQNFAPIQGHQEQENNLSEDWLSAPSPQEEVYHAAPTMSKMDRRGEIIHETTARQTTDSIKKLLDAKNIISGISTFSKNPELSEIAMNLLEPKLEKWCNENLAELVERVVREEIKKLIPRE